MKKSLILKLIFLIILLLLIATVFYRIYQVKDFEKNLREPTEIEKQKIINILNSNMNTTGYEISLEKS
jgi:hypothetical protein